MKPETRTPFLVPMALGLACLAAVQFLLPEGTELWRRAAAGIFSIGLGFQVAAALLTPARRMRLLLEALAFPLLIAAFQFLPQVTGWVLLVAAILWRTVVTLVLRRS